METLEPEKNVTPPSSPPEVSRGKASRQEIALTFDAGAGSAPTSKILAVLAKYNVRVTVFLTGRWVEENPELVRQIIADGHELGNHSYSHPDFTKLTEAEIKGELEKTEAIVQRLTGRTTIPFFRPPFGSYDARVREIVAKEGYHTIYWTLDSTDWREEATRSTVRDRILNYAASGSIVVSHLGSQVTAEALEEVIVGLRGKGFRLVTLSQILS